MGVRSLIAAAVLATVGSYATSKSSGSGGLSSVTADAPLSGSGTSGSHLVCTSATTSTAGCVSASAQSFSGEKTLLDGEILPTGKPLKLNVGGTSEIQDSSGNVRVDVATGKELDLYVNNSAALQCGASSCLYRNGYFQVVDSSLYARATEYAHVYMYQGTYGGTAAYTMTANPTAGAGNTAFKMAGVVQGGTTALSVEDFLQIYGGTSANTKEFLINSQGMIQLNIAGGAEPTCDSGHRGMVSITQSAGGAGDILRVCMKGTADTYAWRSAFTAP